MWRVPSAIDTTRSVQAAFGMRPLVPIELSHNEGTLGHYRLYSPGRYFWASAQAKASESFTLRSLLPNL